MKYKKNLLYLTLVPTVLVSCSEMSNNPAAEEEVGGIRLEVADFVDVDGIFAKDDAKSTFTYNKDKGFVFAWTDGDEIGIFPISTINPQESVSNPQQMMMVVDTDKGSTLSSAGYNGSTVGWSVNGNIEYASYYPMQEDYDLLPGNIILDYTGQKQNGNDEGGENMGHLGAYDYLYTEKTKPKGLNDIKFSFKHAGAIVRFRVPTDVSGTFTSLSVTTASGNNVFPVKMKLDLFNKSITVKEYSSTFSVSLAGFESNGGESNYLNVWCMMPPVDLSSESLIVTFNKGTASRNINYEIAGRELEPGKAYSFNGTDASLPDFIDLGLPSGTLWASWNVGATSETEVGNYYAWGETDTKTTYSRETYKYYSNSKYTRYNDADHTYLSLLPEDDVVTVTYGSKYRMPSSAELTELKEFLKANCTSAIENKGIRYSYNGESIFFPKSGYINGTSTTNPDYVTIWANDRNYTGSTTNVNSFSINGTGNISTTTRNRVYGQPVRAVKPKSN